MLGRLTEESAQALVEVVRHPSRPLVQVRAIGGAANDIALEATAYVHRAAEVLVTVTAFPPQGSHELHAATRPLWGHAIGAYRNFESRPSAETFDRAFPGATGERVRDLAQKYDPAGILRRSQT